MSAFQLLLFIIITSPLISLHVAGTELPCEFSFDRKFGYTCRVFDYSNDNPNAEISEITGDHLYRGDKNHRSRNDSDVYRLIFWKLELQYLPGNITHHFSMLRTLQIKNCGTKALTRSAELNGLRRLYLGFNEIESIPKTFFWGYCRLEILSFFNNQITTIHKNAFRDLIKLKRLSLNQNRLKALESTLFENCINLEVVDLDSNELTAINGDLFANQPLLRKVFLQNNQLTAIESHFLSQVINLKLSTVLFRKNKCIDFVYPDDGNFEAMQEIFMENCKPPPLTTTERRTTPYQQTLPPPYKTPQILYFEKCQWKVHPDYVALYRVF